MSGEPLDDDAEHQAAQNADLDAVADELAAEARLFAARQHRLATLVDRATNASGSAEQRFLPLELAGSWRISWLTAARWTDDADRYTTALPLTLQQLCRRGRGR